jgi:hypothetical protein
MNEIKGYLSALVADSSSGTFQNKIAPSDPTVIMNFLLGLTAIYSLIFQAYPIYISCMPFSSIIRKSFIISPKQ